MADGRVMQQALAFEHLDHAVTAQIQTSSGWHFLRAALTWDARRGLCPELVHTCRPTADSEA